MIYCSIPSLRENHPQRWQQALEAAGCTDKDDEMLQNAKDLDWGDVKMLCNQSLKLCFGDRELSSYGSPYTPQHGLSAFQYHRDGDVGKNRVPRNTDIILTHGPAKSHLDGWKESGCSFFQKGIMRVRPRLVVCGHIQVGYGKEERTYDSAAAAHEAIAGSWAGWGSLIVMAFGVFWSRLIPAQWRKCQRRTTFVNAAVVQGCEKYTIKNEAIVVRI